MRRLSPDAAPLERLAAVEQRLADHESRCEERLGEIRASVASTLKAVEGLKSRFWTISVALLAWALAQIWAGSQARLARLEAAPPEAAGHVRDVGGDVVRPVGHQLGETLKVSGEQGP